MAVEVKPRESSDVETEQLATGCEAIAEAIRLADVDVMAAYPIRPYDGVMQAAAKLIANGKMDVEYIVADGEHSQFEIVKHACAVGSRVFVGSSGVGWFYAFEAIAVTAGLRLPVVAICGNRALDDPGAFGTEHNDSLAVRDLGWLLPWAETAQEAMDLALMAWRVGEDKRVSLPVAIGLDGAFLTHSQQIVKIPTQAAVNTFLPPFDLGDRLLHPDNPITIAPQVDQDWLMEIRMQNDQAMRKAEGVIREAHADFKKLFGRGGESPFLDEYMTDDAEFVFFGQGTLALPMKVAIRRLRKEGHKVGLVRLKWFRPFATEESVRSQEDKMAVETTTLPQIKGVKDVPYEELFVSGHRTCQGCESALVMRHMVKASGPRTIVLGSTGCMYVANTTYYTTPWVVPWMHTQLGASGSAALGTAAGLKVLMRKGKLKNEKINVIAFCGDGGGADMGLGAISATLTHKDYNCLVLLYDNESYANTDIQLSSQTPYGAVTTFSPSGSKKRLMHTRWKKNVPGMLAAGHPESRYIAAGCAAYAVDLMNKIRKALELGGPTFVHTLDPCPKGWDYHPQYSQELGHLAVECGIWPLYEVIDGVCNLTGPTRQIAEGRKKRKPVYEYLKRQGRFAHFIDEDVEHFQAQVDKMWTDWLIPGVIPFTVPAKDQAILKIDKKSKPLHEEPATA